ncbi:MAG: His-Xaa-Ser system radical SAM maturase HxsC [Hyphomonadaceae bacterium]
MGRTLRSAPALYTHAAVTGVDRVRVFKVLAPDEAKADRYDSCNVLVLKGSDDSPTLKEQMRATEGAAAVRIDDLRHPDVVRPGDVVRLRPGSTLVSVLYRRGSNANALFVTEQCNSLCLMCSQPPRNESDRWRLDELHALIDLVDVDEPQLGITGGEPTLLREDLAYLIDHARQRLPNTLLHTLTNGRLFSDAGLADMLCASAGDQAVWAVPIYADIAALHDEIVGGVGAFGETMSGLYELAKRRARVEIRIVLHALSIPRLPQLASYIYRRMPFVEHVAFMGLEPMGFAKMNRDRLWIDPADYQAPLCDAVHHLALRGMSVSIYNLPLCVLRSDLWPFARASISDWKNRDAPQCRTCSVRDACSGFFASAGPQWRSRAIAPITGSGSSKGEEVSRYGVA